MTSINFRDPYSKEELEKLYPAHLKLQLVQVFLRHGERTPVSARFQSAGLPTYWPYCSVARRMTSMVATNNDLSSWDALQWRRQIETFGHDDEAVSTRGPGGETEAICQAGELTDKGRQTTFQLGQRLRNLYVDQLGFMPKIKSDAEDIYLRATHMPRAIESLQQAFMGMYPASARTANFAAPAIVTRSVADETAYPNDASCRRFRQLSRLFADRAAKRWNNSDDMEYLNKLWSKWMPMDTPRVAVDSHPRLSGIMDSINASRAHGPATRLPPQFYDQKAQDIIQKISVEEWFFGYNENVEYRKLGIGSLMGDIVDRMANVAVGGSWYSEVASSSSTGCQVPIKFSLTGCHDTTLAAILFSLGAFNSPEWPPFTSSIAIELFAPNEEHQAGGTSGTVLKELAQPSDGNKSSSPGILSFLKKRPDSSKQSASSFSTFSDIARVPLSEMDDAQRKALRQHYVRLRYNDRVMRVPGCVSKSTNHLPGDDSFCTLEAFKEIVDKYTPKQWKSECLDNLNEGMFGKDNADKSTSGY